MVVRFACLVGVGVCFVLAKLLLFGWSDCVALGVIVLVVLLILLGYGDCFVIWLIVLLRLPWPLTLISLLLILFVALWFGVACWFFGLMVLWLVCFVLGGFGYLGWFTVWFVWVGLLARPPGLSCLGC